MYEDNIEQQRDVNTDYSFNFDNVCGSEQILDTYHPTLYWLGRQNILVGTK